MCEACKEDEYSKITDIEIIVKYNNPKAYGYPEIVNWDDRYKIKNCPFCGRELKDIK